MDRALIERAQRGERAAVEQLLEEIAPLVHRFGLRMCRDSADADDVLQDTLLSVLAHLPEYEGRASLASWVFTLARTACARRRRGRKNRPHLPAEAAGEAASEGSSPEETASVDELRVALDHALDRLSAEQREVILLRDMEGLSAPEVAASLGLSVDAVKSRLHRARAALRAALDDVLAHHPPPPQPGCPDVLAAFSQKLEGELSALDCAAMERHIAGCPACASACSALRTALDVCKAQAAGEIPASLKAQVKAALHKHKPA